VGAEARGAKKKIAHQRGQTKKTSYGGSRLAGKRSVLVLKQGIIKVGHVQDATTVEESYPTTRRLMAEFRLEESDQQRVERARTVGVGAGTRNSPRSRTGKSIHGMHGPNKMPRQAS